jgi:hypothetical protein
MALNRMEAVALTSGVVLLLLLLVLVLLGVRLARGDTEIRIFESRHGETRGESSVQFKS